MNSNSDNYPVITVKSNGKTQVRFNIAEVTKEGINGKSQVSHTFSYAEIIGELTKGKIVDAIIMTVHSKDAEIALINNEIASPGTKEYAEYQAFRRIAKDTADSILGVQSDKA